MILFGIGFARCNSDHSVFVRRTSLNICLLYSGCFSDSDSVCWWYFADWGWLCGLSSNKGVSQMSFCDERYGEAKIFPSDWSYISFGLKLFIKSMGYFYLTGSMHLIFLSANLLALQWKSMWIYGMIVVILLIILDSIGGWLKSWSTWQLLGLI